MTVTSASMSFVDRHIGARRQSDVDAMLKAVGYDTVDALVDTAVPKDIRQDSPLSLGAALDAFVTYDARLADAARAAGMTVVAPA